MLGLVVVVGCVPSGRVMEEAVRQSGGVAKTKIRSEGREKEAARQREKDREEARIRRQEEATQRYKAQQEAQTEAEKEKLNCR